MYCVFVLLIVGGGGIVHKVHCILGAWWSVCTNTCALICVSVHTLMCVCVNQRKKARKLEGYGIEAPTNLEPLKEGNVCSEGLEIGKWKVGKEWGLNLVYFLTCFPTTLVTFIPAHSILDHLVSATYNGKYIVMHRLDWLNMNRM